MPTAPIYGLVCAGGGAHGAYQVGVLKYIHEHFCVGEASPFRVFSGTSAGSLNTAFLAARSFDARTSRLELETMWNEFHVPAYHGNIVKNSIKELLKEWAKPRALRKKSWSLLDPGPLHDIVDKGFRRESFNRAMKDGTTLGLAISATEVRSSRLVWFQEGPGVTSWTTSGSTSFETRLGTSHVQASCSVPLAFPPVKIGDHFYADGGVANKRPFTPAMNIGATRILSVATDQPLPQNLPECPPDYKPRARETVQMLLNQLSHDYAPDQEIMIEIVNFFRQEIPSDIREHLPQPLLTGADVDFAKYNPVEIRLFAPSRRIHHTDIFDPDVFDEALESKSTVLLFRRDFIRDLIDFGYEDASARADELEEFFETDRPQRPSRFSAAMKRGASGR